jgi:hypothetical protein
MLSLRVGNIRIFVACLKQANRRNIKSGDVGDCPYVCTLCIGSLAPVSSGRRMGQVVIDVGDCSQAMLELEQIREVADRYA